MDSARNALIKSGASLSVDFHPFFGAGIFAQSLGARECAHKREAGEVSKTTIKNKGSAFG